ncbi:hypothetical protein A4A49_09796 [Nicotiana attenuata]|uniref:Uncharacterized protein n=1 Tax=Nicotiana attenuata TaxID=49451 RepID=A0A314LFS9_NICAT|nr:hypothetical protein A4A49_09796 [Nicotiana attenuata]
MNLYFESETLIVLQLYNPKANQTMSDPIELSELRSDLNSTQKLALKSMVAHSVTVPVFPIPFLFHIQFHAYIKMDDYIAVLFVLGGCFLVGMIKSWRLEGWGFAQNRNRRVQRGGVRDFWFLLMMKIDGEGSM